jgi:hypothetical protein
MLQVASQSIRVNWLLLSLVEQKSTAESAAEMDETSIASGQREVRPTQQEGEPPYRK